MQQDSEEEKIESFRIFRDQFYEKNPGKTSDHRLQALKEEAAKLIEDVNYATSDQASKVRSCLLCGKILNLLPCWEQRCEDYLSRCVKLDPSIIEGWNELGECLWKKEDVAGAKRCFETALAKRKNPASLRSLALTLRHEGSTTEEEKRENMRKSLNLTEEANKMDSDDSTTTYMLGNAYLTYFFSCGQQDPRFIQKALASYLKAVGYEREKYNADLYYNYAQALVYEQSYEQALIALQRTVKLDPEFFQAKDKLNNLVSFLKALQINVQRKVKLSGKRLEKILTSFDLTKDLGMYGGGSVSIMGGKKISMVSVTIVDLLFGMNNNKVVVGKVVGMVANQETIPYTFTIVDQTGNCCAVTVYNFSERFGLLIGSSVVIPEPYVLDLDFASNDTIVNVRVIRVPTPEILVVNGKKLGKENVAFVQVEFSTSPS